MSAQTTDSIFTPSWLVFDLGGVLMNFNGVPRLSALSGQPEDVCSRQLATSPTLAALETGRMSRERFAQAFVDELVLDVTPAEMLVLWAEWEGGPKPGALDYVRSLQSRYRTACLSNTSIIHWERLCGHHGLDELFEKTYTSFEIGLHKPDPRIFAHVARELGVAPGAITYFDDRADIVQAANTYGFAAYQVCSPAEIASVIATLE